MGESGRGWESETETPERTADHSGGRDQPAGGSSESGIDDEPRPEPAIGAPPDSSNGDEAEADAAGSVGTASGSPPEPSPEEIAFGSDPSVDTDEESTESDRVEDEPVEDEPADTGSVEPAGGPSAGDPLADPTDEE
jgi:hypothetical protein